MKLKMIIKEYYPSILAGAVFIAGCAFISTTNKLDCVDVRAVQYVDKCECGYEQRECDLSYISNKLNAYCPGCDTFTEGVPTQQEKYRVLNSMKAK